MCFGLCLKSHVSEQIPVQENENIQIIPSVIVEKGENVTKVGWLQKRERKKFLVASTERVFCLLKGGVLYYFRAPKIDIKNPEKDLDYLGETDLVGATCKMTIEASHRFGIELNCQNGNGQVIQFNAESHAEQKHWFDAISDQIEVANDAVLRAQGIANEGMKNWYEIKLAEQKAAISSLQSGRKMRKHYIAMGFHRMHDRLVRLDDSGEILLWCDPYATPNERNETTQTNSIPISSIISVKAGAETSALASFASSSDDAGRCFSIFTQEKSYDFECDTRDQRDDFINLLSVIRAQLQRSEVADHAEIKKKHEARRKALRDTVQKSKDLLTKEKKK